MTMQPVGGSLQNRVKPTGRQWVTWIGTAAVLCAAVYFIMTYFFAGAAKKEPVADVSGFGGLPLQRPAEPPAPPPVKPLPTNFMPAPRLPPMTKPETFYAEGDTALFQNGGGPPPAKVGTGMGG